MLGMLITRVTGYFLGLFEVEKNRLAPWTACYHRFLLERRVFPLALFRDRFRFVDHHH